MLLSGLRQEPTATCKAADSHQTRLFGHMATFLERGPGPRFCVISPVTSHGFRWFHFIRFREKGTVHILGQVPSSLSNLAGRTRPFVRFVSSYFFRYMAGT
jgi:hypothetical protein